jgi:hypothetical protein
MAKWSTAHDEQAVACYLTDVEVFGVDGVWGRFARIAKAPERDPNLLAWPVKANASQPVSKVLSNLFAGRLLGRVNPQWDGDRDFSEAEDRRLGNLIDNAGIGERPWSDWVQQFRNRSRSALQARARTIRPKEMAMPPKRCAYGLSRGSRCENTAGGKNSTTFQSVPKSSGVLSHLAIAERDWKGTLVCCSDHGQNAQLPLSGTNLATRPSSASLPDISPFLQTPSKKRPLSGDDDIEPASSERERKRVARRHVLQAEKAAEDVAAGVKRRRDEAAGLLGLDRDPVDVIAELLERSRLAEGEAKSAHVALGEQNLKSRELEEWARSVRPQGWKDIDDTWVAAWTPFNSRAVAQAFYETLVEPRVDDFERWDVYRKAVSVKVLIGDPAAPAAVEEAESESDEEVDLTADRQRTKTERRLRTRLERDRAFRMEHEGVLPNDYVTRKEKKRKLKYKPHSYGSFELNAFQEFLVLMIYLRRGLDKDVLAEKFLGSPKEIPTNVITGIIRTWVCALDAILKVEDWWLSSADAERVRTFSHRAFTDDDAELIKAIADCTNVNCQGSQTNELLRQQLFSTYYKHTCGKFLLACSTIGGCMLCSPAQGGPADDHQVMMGGGLFAEEKWAVTGDDQWSKLLYDAGVSRRTKTVAQASKCDMLTSGIVRNSAKSTLSGLQRKRNFQISSLRIRVENFIGIVKQRFKLLTKVHTNRDLPIMDKLVYVCFMLHNFGPPIIK